jgi:hypothetical protein
VGAGSIVLVALFATAATLAADTAARGQQPAHQHGAASLHVSVEGDVLQLALESPADNLLGFEHAPRNETQKKAVARAEQLLKQAAQLFEIPPAAECQTQPAKVEMKLPEAASGETHSEVESQWRWKCRKPQALTHVDVAGLFKAFPRLKHLKVQVVTAQGQRTALLKPGAARLKLAS